MAPFVKVGYDSTWYATPAEMYRDLPRRPGAAPALWAHQADTLRRFTEAADEPDLAVELPTGTGKTLVGLLIAEWNRRNRSERVAYACPTRQLAQQVAEAASRQGIDVSLLVGRHRDWAKDAHTAYETARRVAVTTYSTVFNSRPRLVGPGSIVFDDAHAGEQFVGQAYAVLLDRQDDHEEYDAVLDVVGPAVDGVFLKRLKDEEDPGAQDVRLVLPLRQPGMVDRMHEVMSRFRGSHHHRYLMIRDGLESCLVYVAHRGILVRPYLPPTHRNRLFSGARQRIYLSATLGEGGELERAFGRPGIVRLEQPDESSAPRCGRRFFVLPDLVPHADPRELARSIVSKAGKALVLAPRASTAAEDAASLGQDDWKILGIDDVETGMGPFLEAEHAVCGLAARYDGLDLPGDTCRLVVLDGVPDQGSLQELFLRGSARCGVVLESRIRTRVIQGAGRCTRGPEDTAIVLVLGKLSGYIGRPEVVRALDPEVQAEIRFGLDNSSAGTAEGTLENVDAFLNQDTDDTWRTEAEPCLVEARRSTRQEPPPAAGHLARCADKEVEAWAAATTRAWARAARLAHEVVKILEQGGSSTRGYRAFWTYLQAAWADQAAQEDGGPEGREAARSLVARAEKTAGMATWVHQMAPFPGIPRSPLTPADEQAVQAVITRLEGKRAENRAGQALRRARDGLQERDPARYEPALAELGRLLGAESYKPEGDGQADCTWCWGNRMWITLEAKSGHEPTGVIPLDDVRQANTQLDLLRAGRKALSIPGDSVSVIISPRTGVHRDGATAAARHLYRTDPGTVLTILDDVGSAWGTVLAERAGLSRTGLTDLVRRSFSDYRVLPTGVRERLTRQPVGTT